MGHERGTGWAQNIFVQVLAQVGHKMTMVCVCCNGRGVVEATVGRGSKVCPLCKGRRGMQALPENNNIGTIYRGYYITHVDEWYRAYKESLALPGSYALVVTASTEEKIKQEIDRIVTTSCTEVVCETQEGWVIMSELELELLEPPKIDRLGETQGNEYLTYTVVEIYRHFEIRLYPGSNHLYAVQKINGDVLGPRTWLDSLQEDIEEYWEVREEPNWITNI